MRRTRWFLLMGLLTVRAQAELYPLGPEQDLIGEAGQTEAEQQDTLPDIARQYHLGFDEIIAANPGVDTWIPGAGTVIRLPMQHLLPDAPRAGIVVNLPDGRLYYFRADQNGNKVVVRFDQFFDERIEVFQNIADSLRPKFRIVLQAFVDQVAERLGRLRRQLTYRLEEAAEQ